MTHSAALPTFQGGIKKRLRVNPEQAQAFRPGSRRVDLEQIEKNEILLCPDCTKLLAYGLTMRLKCPHDPKPMCKKCETQCYHRDYRSKIREVMKFSGLYLIKHGRVDMLYHYFR